jgi:diguanylate cyclase (GGDEF)-like protein
MVNEAKLCGVLGEFARTIITDVPIQRILDRLVDRIIEVLPVTSAGVTLNSQTSTPHYIAASDSSARRFERLQSHIGQGPCVEAFETGHPVSMPDLTVDTRFPLFSPAAVAAGIVAVFTFPLFHGDDRFGALDLYRDTTGDLDAEDVAVAQTLADVAAALLVNAKARDEARATSDRFYYNAMHDPLTGLPNRQLLQERLEHASLRAQRAQKFTAVLFLDLDRFKRVNDTYGHHIGDQLLCRVADRLAGVVRVGDTLSRFSGDEFVFLCEELDSVDDVSTVVARINETFREPFHLAGANLAVSVQASVGVAYVGPGEAVTADLLTRADLDMYRAKRHDDSAGVEIIQVARTQPESFAASLEGDMRQALDAEQLELAYQPIIRTIDGSVSGLEALLRWTHPHRGPIPPLMMVAAAERSDLIGRIGAWVLEQACRDHASWVADNPGRSVDLAVNVSVRQLAISDFCLTVSSILDSTGMDPESLIFEITESIAIEHSVRIAQVLVDLSMLGVRLALDDFGTGYSALSYLSRLPIDIVKLDRSLIAELDQPSGRIVLVAVADMAHELGLEVVAEGIETQAQRDESAAIGCDYTQGYLHAHPMPSENIHELLADLVEPTGRQPSVASNA